MTKQDSEKPSKIYCRVDRYSGKFIIAVDGKPYNEIEIDSSAQLKAVPGITEDIIHCWVKYKNSSKKVIADELAELKAQLHRAWEVKDGDCVIVKKAFAVTKCYPVDRRRKVKYAVDRVQKYVVGGIAPFKASNCCLINLNGEEFMAYYGQLVKVDANDNPEQVRAKLKERQRLEALIWAKEQQINTTYFYNGREDTPRPINAKMPGETELPRI